MDKAIFKLILEAMRLDKADTLVALGGHDRRWQQRVATRIGLAHPNGISQNGTDTINYIAAFSAHERDRWQFLSGVDTRMA